MYSSTLSLTMALEGDNAVPRSLYPRERPGTHCIGGWMGPRAGAENLAPHRDSIPGPSSPSRDAIPAELSRPPRLYHSNHMSTTKVTASPILNLDGTCRWATDFTFRYPYCRDRNPSTHFIGGFFGRYGCFREKKNLLAVLEFEPRTVDCSYSNCIIQLICCLVSNVIKPQGYNVITKKRN
jgi:hypothetical protein